MSANTEKWTDFYHVAVLETDGPQLSGRIVDARRAIARRLQDLTGDNGHHDEIDRITRALRTLELIEEVTKDGYSANYPLP